MSKFLCSNLKMDQVDKLRKNQRFRDSGGDTGNRNPLRPVPRELAATRKAGSIPKKCAVCKKFACRTRKKCKEKRRLYKRKYYEAHFQADRSLCA